MGFFGALRLVNLFICPLLSNCHPVNPLFYTSAITLTIIQTEVHFQVNWHNHIISLSLHSPLHLFYLRWHLLQVLFTSLVSFCALFFFHFTEIQQLKWRLKRPRRLGSGCWRDRSHYLIFSWHNNTLKTQLLPAIAQDYVNFFDMSSGPRTWCGIITHKDWLLSLAPLTKYLELEEKFFLLEKI